MLLLLDPVTMNWVIRLTQHNNALHEQSFPVPLIGTISCGHVDITTTTSWWARRQTKSPGLDNGGQKSVLPSSVNGMFIQRLSGDGVSGAVKPISAIAVARLSVQL